MTEDTAIHGIERPSKTHFGYVQDRRTDPEGEALLAEALARLRARRGSRPGGPGGDLALVDAYRRATNHGGARGCSAWPARPQRQLHRRAARFSVSPRRA
ncbi:MAG: RNA polymerase-binding protein RbpA [Pseudonocardiaceae bacterium]